MWLPTKKDFLFSCQLQLAESAHKSIALFSEGTLHLKYEKFVQKKSHPAPPLSRSQVTDIIAATAHLEPQ
jgi:hypothetical protein